MAVVEPVALPAPNTTNVDVGKTDAGAAARGLSFEALAYLALLLLALVAHLWQLGDRALHHDETLHAFYSWQLYQGRGYTHDPLMHGPFLYYWTALLYFLFGDSDTTARVGAALFGIALVGLPWLLRQELGRGAALLAAAYFAISPAFLYVGRFLRHDIFAVVFELLCFIGAVRYATTRRPAYLYLAVGSFAFMVTTMETSYLFAAIFAPVLLVLLLWRTWRPGIALVGGLGVALALLLFVLPGHAQKDGQNNALRDAEGRMQYTPGLFGWRPLETDDNAWALSIRHRPDDNLGAYLRDLAPFFAHPAVLLGLVLSLATVVALYVVVWRRRGPDGLTRWQRAQGDGVVATFASLGENKRLWWALSLFALIYGLFYTAFLTNALGLLTGTTGSLLYWLAQHDVRRGDQPWYYYLVLLVVYEPLLLLWGAIGLGAAAVTAFGLLRRKHAQDVERAPRKAQHVQIGIVLGWWSLAALLVYGWAGEKMPWLTIHMWLPLALLGAWAAARLVPRLLRGARRPLDDEHVEQPQRFGALWLYVAACFVVAALSFVLLSVFSATPADQQGRLAIAVVAVVGLLVATLFIIAALTYGWRWSLGGLLVGLSVLLLLGTLRNAAQLNYRYGDTPVEMMVFVQTSPDVARVMRRLEAASIKQTGRLDMPVIYDNETVWQWYLRNFREATGGSSSLPAEIDPTVQAVLLLDENLTEENRARLDGFVIQRYPLRWWFPENEFYRLGPGWRDNPDGASLLGRVLLQPFDARTVGDLWQYLTYRRPPGPLGSTDFVIAVRPTLAPQLGLGTGASTTAP
jgi:predicted membrane-bound mannosyltransferase